MFCIKVYEVLVEDVNAGSEYWRNPPVPSSKSGNVLTASGAKLTSLNSTVLPVIGTRHTALFTIFSWCTCGVDICVFGEGAESDCS